MQFRGDLLVRAGVLDSPPEVAVGVNLVGDLRLTSLVGDLSALEAQHEHLEREVAVAERVSTQTAHPTANGRGERVGLIVGAVGLDGDHVNGQGALARRIGPRCASRQEDREKNCPANSGRPWRHGATKRPIGGTRANPRKPTARPSEFTHAESIPARSV
jgi:hypothetical protein